MRVFQQKDAMIWLIDVCDLHRLDASEGRLYEIGLGVRELPEARSGSGRDLIVGRRVPRRRHLEGAPPLRSRTHQEVRVAVRPRVYDCGGLRSLRVVPRRVPYCLLHFEKISSGNFRGKCRNRGHKSASAAAAPAHAFAARTAYNRRNGESTAHMAIHGR